MNHTRTNTALAARPLCSNAKGQQHKGPAPRQGTLATN
jgi:hypothetical protein